MLTQQKLQSFWMAGKVGLAFVNDMRLRRKGANGRAKSWHVVDKENSLVEGAVLAEEHPFFNFEDG